jgi:hypothetical protein
MARFRKQPGPPEQPAPMRFHRGNIGDDECPHPDLENGWKVCHPLLVLMPRLDPRLAEIAEAARDEHEAGGLWPPREDA